MDKRKSWLAIIGVLMITLLSGCVQAIPSIAPEGRQGRIAAVYLGQKSKDFAQAFLEGAQTYSEQQEATVQLQLITSPEQLSEEVDIVVTSREEANAFASSELLLLEESEAGAKALGREIGRRLLQDLQERGAEIPQVYFLGNGESEDWQIVLYEEICKGFAQNGKTEEPQEKTVLQQQIAQWLEEHQGEIAVVAVDEQMALDLQQSAVEAGHQHEISIFSLEYSREIERAIRAALIYGALLENPIQMGENTVRKFRQEVIMEPGRVIICRENLDLPEIKTLRTFSE